jgi:hypothetical protein
MSLPKRGRADYEIGWSLIGKFEFI